MKRISALFTSFLITILVMLLPYVVMAATPVIVVFTKSRIIAHPVMFTRTRVTIKNIINFFDFFKLTLL